jgi:hypothetical protein
MFLRHSRKSSAVSVSFLKSVSGLFKLLNNENAFTSVCTIFLYIEIRKERIEEFCLLGYNAV